MVWKIPYSHFWRSYSRLNIRPIDLALQRQDVCPQTRGDSPSPQISHELLRLPSAEWPCALVKSWSQTGPTVWALIIYLARTANWDSPIAPSSLRQAHLCLQPVPALFCTSTRCYISVPLSTTSHCTCLVSTQAYPTGGGRSRGQIDRWSQSQ